MLFDMKVKLRSSCIVAKILQARWRESRLLSQPHTQSLARFPLVYLFHVLIWFSRDLFPGVKRIKGEHVAMRLKCLEIYHINVWAVLWVSNYAIWITNIKFSILLSKLRCLTRELKSVGNFMSEVFSSIHVQLNLLNKANSIILTQNHVQLGEALIIANGFARFRFNFTSS